MRGVVAAELVIEVPEGSEVKDCEKCGVPIMNNNFERCTVCGIVICPRCDIRFKDLTKPTCHPHSG